MSSVLLLGRVWCRYSHCLLFSTFQKTYLDFGVSWIHIGVHCCLLSDLSSIYRIIAAYSSKKNPSEPTPANHQDVMELNVQLKIRKALNVWW